MSARAFGGSDVRLGPWIYGTMRFDPARIGRSEARALLRRLYDAGVRAFHTSHEYAHHDYFCEVLAALRREIPSAEIAHVAKIAEPHFEVDVFSAARFRQLIDGQLRALGAARIDVVQWQLRYRPAETARRLAILEAARHDLADVMEELRREGKVGVLATDPYGAPFAGRALDTAPVGGLVTYLNLHERDMVPLLAGMAARGQGFVAIRPLGAGWLTADGPRDPHENPGLGRSPQVERLLAALGLGRHDLVPLALRFPLLHPAVSSIVTTATAPAHVDQVLAAVSDCEPSLERFQHIVDACRTVDAKC